jgi:hypothetical protein
MPDYVPVREMRAAADRLEELREKCNIHYETICELTKERDEFRAEVEQLKAYPTRPEPSRLEIAAMFFQGMRASGCIWGDPEKVALEDADKLIKRAQEVK